MVTIEGLRECKHCKALPDFAFSKKWFDFTCPKCGHSSTTSVVHGMAVAIEDWNRYHADRK